MAMGGTALGGPEVATGSGEGRPGQSSKGSGKDSGRQSVATAGLQDRGWRGLLTATSSQRPRGLVSTAVLDPAQRFRPRLVRDPELCLPSKHLGAAAAAPMHRTSEDDRRRVGCGRRRQGLESGTVRSRREGGKATAGSCRSPVRSSAVSGAARWAPRAVRGSGDEPEEACVGGLGCFWQGGRGGGQQADGLSKTRDRQGEGAAAGAQPPRGWEPTRSRPTRPPAEAEERGGTGDAAPQDSGTAQRAPSGEQAWLLRPTAGRPLTRACRTLNSHPQPHPPRTSRASPNLLPDGQRGLFVA